MAKVLELSSASGSAFTATRYFSVTALTAQTTEAPAQRTTRTAGTYSLLRIRVITNATSAPSTVDFRINGGSGSLTISVTSGATGEFQDSTNSDSVSAGDEVNYRVVPGSANNFLQGFISALFEASSNTVKHLISTTTQTVSAASTAYVAPLNGSHFGGVTTEAWAQIKSGTAGTLKNGFVYVATNARGTATTVRSRVNGGNGNISISCTASTTGIFEDTSNTDTIAVDDLINSTFTTGTGTGNFLASIISFEFETTNGKTIAASCNMGSFTKGAASNTHWGFNGTGEGAATESTKRAEVGVVSNYSRLYLYVSANTMTGTTTLTMRENGSNQAVTLSVGAAATGAFEDASNIFYSNATTDEVNPQTTGGTSGTLTMRSFSLLVGTPTATSSERGAKISGVAVGASERDAKIHGASTSSSERDSKVTGFANANAERDAKISGESNVSSERGAKIRGVDSASSERSAKVVGALSSSAERDAKISGIATIPSERDAKIHGQSTASSERDAKVTGALGATSERDAKIHGTATTNAERDAKITGFISITSERDAKIRGQVEAASSRAAFINGGTDADDERAATIHGEATASSERDAKVTGTDADDDERAATIHGQAASSSERDAIVHGQDTASAERDAKVSGQDSASSERDSKVTGVLSAQAQRRAKIVGWIPGIGGMLFGRDLNYGRQGVRGGKIKEGLDKMDPETLMGRR